MNATPDPKIPAHIERYVDVLGPEDAVRFLLKFGGTDLYIPARPQSGSPLVQLLGRHKAEALGLAMGPARVKLPVAKPFIAKFMKAKNVSTAEIARTLHTTDVTVRKWLADEKSSRQLDMFE